VSEPTPPTQPTADSPAATPPAPESPPDLAATWDPPEPQALVLPQTSPDRADRRRTRPGRFLGGLVPILAASVTIPGALCAALLMDAAGRSDDVGSTSLSTVGEDAAAIRAALADAEQEVRALSEPAFQMARVEAKRAAYRGAILVEQEARRLGQEQQHALVLEAALARNPALGANAARKLPPVAPASLEPFIRRVGLASPGDADEGEIVVDDAGAVVGGVVPLAFSELITQVKDGTAELGGRVVWRAPVTGQPLSVIAVRKLPAGREPVALATVSSRLARMERAASQVPKLLGAMAQQRTTLVARLHEAVALSVAASLLCLVVALFELLRRVIRPLRAVREDVERVRSGSRPIPGPLPHALQDLHASLDDVAQRLQDARTLEDVRTAREAVLDGIMEACARAQAGDFTARPRNADGGEGMAALAVAHLLDDVEQRVLRMRSLAANLQGELAACDVSVTGSLPPDTRTSVDLLKARIETLNVVPTLLKNVCIRLDALAAHPQATALSEDVKKLSAAVLPRALAVTSVLKEMQDAASRLTSQLSASTAPVQASDALARARNLAQELARETRSVRVEQSFPAMVGALRDLGPSELRRLMVSSDAPSA